MIIISKNKPQLLSYYHIFFQWKYIHIVGHEDLLYLKKVTRLGH